MSAKKYHTNYKTKLYAYLLKIFIITTQLKYVHRNSTCIHLCIHDNEGYIPQGNSMSVHDPKDVLCTL